MNLSFFRKKSDYYGEVTGISIYWKNGMHGLPGIKLKKREFELNIPFKNKKEEGLSFLKQTETTEIIESIEVKEPFKLLNISPEVPTRIASGESVEFQLKIQAPEHNYSGPLVLKMNPKPVEMVHVELPEIIASGKGKSVKVNEHGEVKSIEKNGSFEFSLQMYRVLSYNDTVKSISCNKPFEFLGSEPKLPFTIDNKSSYVVSLFIKGPDFDYAGKLEINFEV